METMDSTADNLPKAISTIKRADRWTVLTVNGFKFKIFGLWAQVLQHPDGTRMSGSMYHKTQNDLVTEIKKFMGVQP